MRKILFVLTAVLLIAVLSACSAQHSAPAPAETSAPAFTEAPAADAAPTATEAAEEHQANGIIDVDEAKAAAMADAGFEAAQVQFTKESLDTDDGIQKYEIEFTSDGYEYEYDINPQTGEVIEKSKELID